MEFRDKWYEDYQVGESRRTLSRTITETDIVIHAGQTGDFYPHHMDAEWTKTQPYQQRIAHGTLILSIAVGMSASDINPQAMSYGYDQIRFIKPVFIGDTISVKAEITEKTDHAKKPERFGLVYELVSVSNQLGETVMVLTHVYLVNKRL